MKILTTVTAVVLIATAVPGAVAQQSPDPERMHQRFQQMDRMVDEAQGPQRHQLMREHMRMMQEQMQAMHGMMGPGGGGDHSGPGDGGRMGRMQERMDMMQRMMEQMLKQQEMQMAPEGTQ